MLDLRWSFLSRGQLLIVLTTRRYTSISVWRSVQEIRFDKEHGGVKLVIAILFLENTMLLIFSHQIPDRHSVLSHRTDHLIGLARRYDGIVFTLDDEKRLGDLRGIDKGRGPLEK